ncbi:MAG: response regulator [Bacteriovoracaceae bacterium]|jgi:DNA-binding response OmpR family regulator|nr:response regulator [Bacteriovoracaceae bacterium]
MSEFLIYTIDDDQDFNMILKMALKPFDIEIKTYNHPQEFTLSVKKRMPNLCILDLNLKNDGEGFQLLKAMRNVLGEELPIFIMSKRGNKEDVLRAMEYGATDFIPKPLDDRYLLLKLKDFAPHLKKLKELEAHYSKVSEQDSSATLDLDFELMKVGLGFIEIRGEFLLTKESQMSLAGDALEEIFGHPSLSFKVLESWQIDETHFGARLERELTVEQIFSLRRYLLAKGFSN